MRKLYRKPCIMREKRHVLPVMLTLAVMLGALSVNAQFYVWAYKDYDANGSFSIPAGTSKITVEAIGGGGGGGTAENPDYFIGVGSNYVHYSTGGGGGGGAYARLTDYAITSGTLSITVGSGGGSDSPGGYSEVKLSSGTVLVHANGGSKGNSAKNGAGSGGNGGGHSGYPGYEGAIGSAGSAGVHQNGGGGSDNANANTGGAGGACGKLSGQNPKGGAWICNDPSGAGAPTTTGSNDWSNGNTGNSYGGGGSGGRTQRVSGLGGRGTKSGGSGAKGHVRVWYYILIDLTPKADSYMACAGEDVKVELEGADGYTYAIYTQQMGGTYSNSTDHTLFRKTNSSVEYAYVQAIANGSNVGDRIAVPVLPSAFCGGSTSDISCQGTELYYEDFGGNNTSDPNYSSSDAGFTSQMHFVPGTTPGRGDYGILKHIPSSFTGFPAVANNSDHTHAGDITRGYFMFIDPADYSMGQTVAETTINNLCDNSELTFSFWASDMWDNTHSASEASTPKFDVQLINPETGRILVQTSQCTPARTAQQSWHQFGVKYAIPAGLTSVKFRLVNRENNGMGNDYGIDDIKVTFCGADVIQHNPESMVCEGEEVKLETTVSVALSVIPNPKFKWQKTNTPNDESSWQTLAITTGENANVANGVMTVDANYVVTSAATSADAGYYRMFVADEADIANVPTNSKCAIRTEEDFEVSIVGGYASDDYFNYLKGSTTTVELDVLANDGTLCGNSTPQVTTAPTQGTVIWNATDKVFLYTPSSSATGDDEFKYSLTCGGCTSEATVHILEMNLELGCPTGSDNCYTFPNATFEGHANSLSIAFGESPDGGYITLPSEQLDGTTVSYTYSDDAKTIVSSAFISKEGGLTESQVQSIIRSATFCLPSADMVKNITVMVDGSVTPSQVFYFPDNEHYFIFMKYDTTTTTTADASLTWIDCYNRAKSMNYMGRKGYLATVTSADEDIFLSRVCNAVAWLGGTRINHGADDGALHYASFDTDHMTMDDTATYHCDKWYWACGPEKGKIFFPYARRPESFVGNADAYKALTDDHGQPIYSNWTVGGEPNLGLNPTNGQHEEAFLTNLFNGADGVYFSGYSWNDRSIEANYVFQRTQYAPHGYLVEFGDQTIGNSTPDDMSHMIMAVATVGGFDPGEIGTGETICMGLTPSTITSVRKAKGGQGDITYEWQLNDGVNTSVISGASGETYTPTVTAPGTYIYTRYAKADLCETTSTASNSWTLVINPVLEFELTGAEVCNGLTTELCAPEGAQSYEWNTTETERCITVNSTGDYTVTVTAEGGCISEGTATVTLFDAANPGAINVSVNVCSYADTTVKIISATPASGGAPDGHYEWQMSDNTSFTTYEVVYTTTNLTTGGYAIPINQSYHKYYRRAYVNDCGTVYTEPVYVINSGTIDPGAVQGNDQEYCAGSEVNETVNVGTITVKSGAPYTVQWQTSTDNTNWTDANAIVSTESSDFSYTYTSTSFNADVYIRYYVQVDGCDPFTCNGVIYLKKNPLPVIAIEDVTSDNVICPSVGTKEITGKVTTATTANYTYTWSGDLTVSPATTTTSAVQNTVTATIPTSCDASYTVTLNVTDGKGCAAQPVSKTVVVKNEVASTITCAESIERNTDEHKGYATVSLSNPTYTGNCAPSYEITYSPAMSAESGATATNASGQYPIGTTTVTYTVTDVCNQTDECYFTVKVVDKEDPCIGCDPNDPEPFDPTKGVSCTTIGAQNVNNDAGQAYYTHSGTDWDVTASDNSGEVSLTWKVTDEDNNETTGSNTLNGAQFNLGVNTVKWTATDPSGNYDECTFTVTVKATDDEVDMVCPTGTSITKTYDGTPLNPTASATSLIRPTDVFTIEYNTVDPTDETKWSTTVPSITDAGELHVYARALNSNYETATCEYTLTITKRQLTITGDFTKVYDGKPFEVNYNQLTYVGLQNGDAFTSGVVSTTSVPAILTEGYKVGDYYCTANQFMRYMEDLIAYNRGFGPESVTKNYTPVFEVVLHITQRPIELTANSDNKVYDGTPLSNNGYTVTGGDGWASTDEATVTVAGEANDPCVGEVANKFTNVKVTHTSDDVDVTDCYDFDYVDGMLVITDETANFNCVGTKTFTVAEGTSSIKVTEAMIGAATYSGTATNVSITSNIPEGGMTMTVRDEPYVVVWSLRDACGHVMTTCPTYVTVQYTPCEGTYEMTDGIYPYKRIGSQCWFLVNLREKVGDYHPYKDNNDNTANFGYLYSWYTAAGVTPEGNTAAPQTQNGDDGQPYVQGICPAGWSIGSQEDYEILNDYATDVKYLKDPSTQYWQSGLEGVNSTDNTGFGARGGGWYNSSVNRYDDLMIRYRFWTSDSAPGTTTATGGVINYYCDSIMFESSQKADRRSVRCIRKVYTGE